MTFTKTLETEMRAARKACETAFEADDLVAANQALGRFEGLTLAFKHYLNTLNPTI